MVTIKIPGNPDVKLNAHEFNELATALKTMIKWESGGMYGDGSVITDKVGYNRAHRVLYKLGYKIK